MDKKQIRFINSRYHDLFTVPDGGNVVITRYDGEKLTRPCKYVDETHVEVGNYLYHICEFAEKMEAAGNTYRPEVPETIHGYAIIRRVDFDNRRGVALAYNPNAVEPFVTWVFSEGRQHSRDYDLGRYRGSLSAAQRDFCERRDSRLEDGDAKVVYEFDHSAEAPEHPPRQAAKEGQNKTTKAPENPSR